MVRCTYNDDRYYYYTSGEDDLQHDQDLWHCESPDNGLVRQLVMHCPFNKSGLLLDVCSLPIESCYVQFDVVGAYDSATMVFVWFLMGALVFAVVLAYIVLYGGTTTMSKPGKPVVLSQPHVNDGRYVPNYMTTVRRPNVGQPSTPSRLESLLVVDDNEEHKH